MKSTDTIFRIMTTSLIVVFSFVLVLFAMEQNAWGYSSSENSEEYLDFQTYTGNRLIVFNDTSVDYCVTDNENPKFNQIAINAIKTWHERIVEVTGNPFVWDMTMHIEPNNESICDGYVNFVKTPNPTLFQLSGVAGYSHPLTPVANVTIYTDDYQSTLLNMAEEDKHFWKSMTSEKFHDIVKNGNHKQFDYETINRITLHEIGHSLSLNHPITSNGNLHESSGIMGYNMSYNQIDDSEVIRIVKAYPNGFSKVHVPESIKLDNPRSKKIVHLGEVTTLTIELPDEKGRLPPSGFEVYIFPEGTISQKPEFAPIKILKTDGMNYLVNNEVYLKDIRTSITHWDAFAKVLSIQFKVVKEFDNADIIVIGHNVGGFEKQWFLNDVMTVDKALFSHLLLDLDTTEYSYHLMSINPNRELEQTSAFEVKQKELYNSALSECLMKKNMKKCQDEIKIDDFEQKEESTPIWMPILTE